jgi:hypothetical protein
MSPPQEATTMHARLSRLTARAVLLSAALTTGCMSLDYDLGDVPVPVSAQSDSRAGADVENVTLEKKHVLWVHGLFGESEPDVGQMVAEASAGYSRVADFRVEHGAGFHDWLITHLSLTLVRMKTVRVEMRRIR